MGPNRHLFRLGPRTKSHSRICNPKHGANETRRVLIVASSTCPLPIPKRTCRGCGTIQAMGSLCPTTKSMQVSSHVVCSQFHKEFAVDLGCYHFLYDPGPEPPMSVLQLKENFNSECQCHRIYDPLLFRSLLYNSGCSHCMHAPWMYDPWLLRLSPLQLKKYLQCKQVAVALHV